MKRIAIQSSPCGGEVGRARRKREVEHRQRREHEDRHRGQRLPRAQLEQEVLAQQRRDVAGVAHANASRAVASGATRSGSWVATTAVARRSASSRCEQLGAGRVERVERLVEEQQARLVQERAAEREPLQHPARVGAGPLVPHLPEAEALEQHPAPLAPLGHAVEAAVELEVLERGEPAVDERVVAEEADLAPVGAHLERAARRDEQARRRAAAASSSRSRSARSRAGSPTPAGRGRRRRAPACARSAARARARGSRHATSASTKARKTALITPFIVKNAALSRRRSSGRIRRCSTSRSPATAATPSQ